MRPRPDFVIVGAPKCGTTSLASWLAAHPSIFMSPIKEPNYFCFDSGRRRTVDKLEVYERLFAPAQYWQTCGEASTSYLYSDVAVPEIRRCNPRTHFIAMVRNPLEMVVSLHAQKLYSQIDHVPDFKDAWRLSPQREPWLDYRAQGLLGRQIKHLQGLVPQDDLLVLVFDDLVARPAAVYRDVLLFLGARPEEAPGEFPICNPRKQRRSMMLERLLRHPPPPFGWVKRKATEWAPIGSKVLRRKIDAMNSRPAPRKQPDGALRREMAEYFADDIALLGQLLNRDLSHWSRA